MTLRLRHFDIALLTLIALPSYGAPHRVQLELFLSHRYQFIRAPILTQNAMAVHTSFDSAHWQRSNTEDLIYAVIRDRLSREQVPTVRGSSSFLPQFQAQIGIPTATSRQLPLLSSLEIFQPRLIAHFEIKTQDHADRYELKSFFSVIYFVDRARLSWEPVLLSLIEDHTRDVPSAEIHKNLVLMTRRSLERASSILKRFSEHHQPAAPSTRPRLENQQVLFHTIFDRGADSRFEECLQPIAAGFPSRWSLGVSVGTPANGNVLLGLWGLGKAPLAIQLSGMYFNPEVRGLQADVGWIWDQSGSYQQSLNASLSLLNESSHEAVPAPADLASRATAPTARLHRLIPFVGATYTSQWGPLRFQAGPALRLGPGNGHELRFLVQVGFVPLLSW